ncbi:MAG: hypothetical protein CL933_04795 [Deltaproteobacteria bacterium]|nr:hypothetical protein [Deltaproteobacteria bacterium]
MSELGWRQKMPVVSLLFAVAMAGASFMLAQDPVETSAGFEEVRDGARIFFVRHPRLEVDALGELILDPLWLVDTRAASANSEPASQVQLPPRVLARSQARLDRLIGAAYDARMQEDPAWRVGILDAGSPGRNYVAHAFVHETTAGVILSVFVLLLVGIPLERTWGSTVFAAFVVGAIPTTAQAFRMLDASGGVPWSGGAGLAGALLGAYFIRGLGGHFVVPGWILLPVWLGLESFLVRGFWFDDPGGVPWATLFSAVGFGAFVAGGLRLINIEARVNGLASRHETQPPNPIVLRAARLRSDGDPYQAFDLIQAAWRDAQNDPEVCEMFYSIAVEVGQPAVAAEAILPQLRTALRQGDVARAIDYWLPLAACESDVALEATPLVRLAEALLDAGYPDEALHSLRLAVGAGVSSAHATRIANIARDLDADLTRQVATIALADPDLDPQTRADLALIVIVPSADPPQPAEPVVMKEALSQFDRRVQAEHQTIETTQFPLGLEADLDAGLDADFSVDLAEPDTAEMAPEEQVLHAGALSAESLAADATPRRATDASVPEESGDVLSHWDGPDSLQAEPLTDVSGALGEAGIGEAILEPGDLESPGLGFDFGLRSDEDDLVDRRDDETDTDFTPLMGAMDELTSPMTAPAVDSAPDQGGAADDFAFGSADDQPTSIMQLRPLKALEAVPLETSGEWVEIDVDGRGKSKLPYARIQAISVAAVLGLGPRPVLILDFVLNWRGDASEPMKLIRFRSDRFDPFKYSPDTGDPLAALTAWVVELEGLSGAICLPTRGILKGHFTRHASLEVYEREVLMASPESLMAK